MGNPNLAAIVWVFDLDNLEVKLGIDRSHGVGRNIHFLFFSK